MISLKVLEQNNILKEEETIKKSKFITYIAKIKDKKELNYFIEKYKELNATHNCYAFRFGTKKLDYGYNNDGEPSGTAGEPLLKLIEVNNLTNIVIFVVRYFGGIKLGTGGLQKAYSSSAIKMIKKSTLRKLEFLINIDISFNISDIKYINLFFKKIEAKDLLYTYKDNKVFLNTKIINIDELKPIMNKIEILKKEENYY